MEYDPLERDAISMILAGDDPVLEVLRNQFAHSSVMDREETGHGFYTNIAVAETVTPLHELLPVRSRFAFGEVGAFLGENKHMVGFLLWVEEGRISTLERFSFEDDDIPLVRDIYTTLHLGPRSLEPPAAPWELPS